MTVNLPYQLGDRVRHRKFGVGTVIDIKVYEGQDAGVTVAFDPPNGTTRTIVSSFLSPVSIDDPAYHNDSVGKEWQPYDRVYHSGYGIGIVQVVGSKYIGVLFDQGEVLLKLETAELCREEDVIVEPWPEVEGGTEVSMAWPESTFTLEDREEGEEDPHTMGSHWEPFGDVKKWMMQLPDILSKLDVQIGFGSEESQSPYHKIPSEWPTGYVGVWPLRTQGMGVVNSIHEELKQVLFKSAYPFFAGGSQHTTTLNQVTVWKDGCEAQITVSVGLIQVTFYDTHFLINRAWYVAGEAYDFILTGIAYSAKPADFQELTVFQNPEVAAWLARLEREEGREVLPDLNPTYSTEGMASLLPIEEWDVDDYTFTGPIQSVRDVEEILGQQAWLLEVTVLRFSEDVNLKILVTRSVWQGSEPPQAGENVEGRLWLQGYLWRAHGS